MSADLPESLVPMPWRLLQFGFQALGGRLDGPRPALPPPGLERGGRRGQPAQAEHPAGDHVAEVMQPRATRAYPTASTISVAVSQHNHRSRPTRTSGSSTSSSTPQPTIEPSA